jgi:hypothetical protein
LFQKHGIDLTVPQAQMNLDIDNKELEEKYGKERYALANFSHPIILD